MSNSSSNANLSNNTSSQRLGNRYKNQRASNQTEDIRGAKIASDNPLATGQYVTMSVTSRKH